MGTAFQTLARRDGTPISVPLMPSSSGPAPEAFKAPCCGQRITGEAVTVLGSRTLWRWHYCACMREAMAWAEEQRAQAEAAREQAARWVERQTAIVRHFPQWQQSAKVPRQTLESFRVTSQNQAVWERVSAWAEQPRPVGFVLMGPVGTGKSHMVRGVGHRFLARRQTVLYASIPYLLERLRSASTAEVSEILTLHGRADLVIWDDLGAERPTDWTRDRLYLLLDARYEAEQPLIATANGSPSQLEERWGSRMVSRLLEMTAIWDVAGGDYRLHTAQQRMRAASDT